MELVVADVKGEGEAYFGHTIALSSNPMTIALWLVYFDWVDW